MYIFKYCVACLVTDAKMYDISTKISLNSLGDIYSQLVQKSLVEKSMHVCFECARLLHKFLEFKSKCHRAHNILTAFKGNNSEVKKERIINVDRTINKLKSNLTCSTIKVVDSLTDIEPDIEKRYIKLESNVDGEQQIKKEAENIQNVENESELTNCNTEFEVDNDMPIENHFSEDSLPLDTVISIKNKQKTPKAKKEPKTKKRKIKEKIEKIDIENSMSDDEPLSKVSKNCNKDKENIKKKYPKNFNVSYFEDFATVVFLTPEDAKKEMLLRKDTSNYKNSPFKCEMCFRGFEAKAAFENHMKRHSVEYGEHKCDLCHLRFPEQRFLCKHRLACHKRKFYCKLCPYVCFCTHQAKTHVSLHKGKKYPCKECGEVFSMPNSLLMHKRLKHLTECVCELCGNTFATPRGLYSHNMKIHRQDKNGKLGPKCEDCGIHFATEVAWKKHLVLSSKHDVSNGCKYCGETFSNSEELKLHTKIHARKHANRADNIKLPASCSICEKWLTNRNEYKLHMTSEHPQSDVAKRLDLEDQTPFVCEICGQMFKKQCFLTYHQRKHSGERPYECTQCHKRFQVYGALASHRAVHERARRHACSLCARLFTFKSALNKHMKVHLGIRPHKCAICDKSFINRCDVKLHIKYVHNKVPWPKRDRSKRTNTDGAFIQYS